MAVHYRLQADVPIKGSADAFYEAICSRPHHLPNISSTNLQNCELHGEDDWDSHGHGSIKTWTYSIGGKASQTLKERIELDDATRTMSLIGLEGDLFKEFKVYNAYLQSTPTANGCVVKVTVEYEKLEEDGPDAHKYLDFLISITKDIDSHLCKA